MMSKFLRNTICKTSLKMPFALSARSQPLFHFSANQEPPQRDSRKQNIGNNQQPFPNSGPIQPPPLQDPSQINFEEKKQEEEDDSFFNEGRKKTYVFIVAALGLLGAYTMMQIYTIIYDKKAKKKNLKVKYSGTASIGGPWKLLDMEGNVMTHQDLRGYYYLIYFGFCNCPDICPLTLQKISKAMQMIEKMPESRYFKLKVLFVSVDPDRDSYEKIKRFLNLFEYKKIIGLTAEKNDSPELKDIMQKFKIYASKIYYDKIKEEDKNFKNAYTIDHTIITYLMDDNNNYVNYLGSNLNENELSGTIVESILEHEREKIKN